MAQIGTVRLETQNSGVVDVPVFEPGDSASGIYEYVRVETASGPGFIPVTAPADATYPYLRVQSANDGIVAVTDTAGSDIPDSAILQIDPSQESLSDQETTTTISDFSGSGNDLSGGSVTYETAVQNGEPAFAFNGEILNNTNPTISRPMTVIAAIQSDNGNSATDGSVALSSTSSGSDRAWYGFNETAASYRHFNPDEDLQGGTGTTDWQILTLRFLSDGSIIRKNGSDIVSGSGGTTPWRGFQVGDFYNENAPLVGYLGETLVADADLVSTKELSSQESRFADKYGISLA